MYCPNWQSCPKPQNPKTPWNCSRIKRKLVIKQIWDSAVVNVIREALLKLSKKKKLNSEKGYKRNKLSVVKMKRLTQWRKQTQHNKILLQILHEKQGRLTHLWKWESSSTGSVMSGRSVVLDIAVCSEIMINKVFLSLWDKIKPRRSLLTSLSLIK